MKLILNLFLILLIAVLLYECNDKRSEDTNSNLGTSKDSALLAMERQQISSLLDSFNIAAAKAAYKRYFDFFAKDAIFIGTDATEHWTKDSFMVWAKPFFDRGRAWNFTSIDRHIYFADNARIAWFDELLNTQMKICRGSGVLEKQVNEWKIKQYVLSMAIPNKHSDAVVKIKAADEDEIIKHLGKK
jgi:hypothetical protein